MCGTLLKQHLGKFYSTLSRRKEIKRRASISEAEIRKTTEESMKPKSVLWVQIDKPQSDSSS